MYEAALCSSTMETAQYFECTAARSAMSMSDSAENVPANEDWKEQYKSRDVTVENVVEQRVIVVIQATGHECLTFKICYAWYCQ